ncbi:MAG: hypothetical protein ACYTFG_17350 [Planctomycetota bacterium]
MSLVSLVYGGNLDRGRNLGGDLWRCFVRSFGIVCRCCVRRSLVSGIRWRSILSNYHAGKE